jgi:F0F1-type ATP synthase assembly protein I
MSEGKKLLLEGISDAVGFIGGALAGYWIGQLLGWNLFAEGYGSASMGAIVLVSIGGGAGLQAARHWRRQNKHSSE